MKSMLQFIARLPKALFAFLDVPAPAESTPRFNPWLLYLR